MNKGMIMLGIVGLVTIIGAGTAGAILAVNNGYDINNAPQSVETSKKQLQEEVKLNGWKEESGIWYFYKDNEKQKNWIQDKDSWYYLGVDGKMRTGWIKDNDNWYYLNTDGTMAVNTTIDNCYLNEKGVIEETPLNNKSSVNNDFSGNTGESKYVVTAFEQAKNIILKEDGQFLKKITDPGAYIQLEFFKEETIYDETSSWGIPNEACFSLLIDQYSNGEFDFEYGMYLVGKETGNVYILPHEGCRSAYQIKNNQVAKEFRWPGPDESPSAHWR